MGNSDIGRVIHDIVLPGLEATFNDRQFPEWYLNKKGRECSRPFQLVCTKEVMSFA
jgi:hypothetical protein